MSDRLRILIGYDGRQNDAWEVCRASLLKHSSRSLKIEPISRQSLGMAYQRGIWYDGVQQYDVDGEFQRWPVSTDFALARFWVPYVCGYRGWALFVDCDFLFMDDVAKLFDKRSDHYALMCCQPFIDQDDEPAVKMDGRIQFPYERKRWSALMLFNCAHKSNKGLRPDYLNWAPFLSLHQFDWLKHYEIGRLDDRWQWVQEAPRAVHYTRGMPYLPEHRTHPYADAWFAYKGGNDALDTEGRAASHEEGQHAQETAPVVGRG